MKSFSPAGAATKAYYGLGARTFGNPDGARTGGGAYAAGGANPNGPNQGGGGSPPLTPTFTIDAGPGPGGSVGYGQTFCGVPIFGSITSGALPAFIPPADPFVIGDNVASLGPPGFSVSAFGIFNQGDFTSVQIIELGLTLLTFSAIFFTNGGGCGPSTIWTWPLAGLVAGSPYGFVFV